MANEDPISVFLDFDRWPGTSAAEASSAVAVEVEPYFEADDSQSTNSTPDEIFMVGFVIANIVGIRYYPGRITGREMVALVREPLNMYDDNAIAVLNTSSVKVGHIERDIASVLAPLIDSNSITVEGIVPHSRAGTAKFKIPVQIHVFAPFDLISNVKLAISHAGLQLISDFDPSFALSESVIIKEKFADKGVRGVDEIFKLVDENVSNKEAMEVLEPLKNVIKSELFLHQKEALWWLVHREGSCELPPFWEEIDGNYVNVLTNFTTDTRPEPLQGGVFADDMGLGKTLTLLSLIAFDKDKTAQSMEQTADEAKNACWGDHNAKPKRGMPKKTVTNSRKKQKMEDTHLVNKNTAKEKSCSGKSTLIVCPPVVISTWIKQLKEHTTPGALKTYLYYGERTKDVEELKKYDIVVTTYNILHTEVDRKVGSCDDTPCYAMKWWRVILDEAHLIKNAEAGQSRSVMKLEAKHRWVVTGTPIQNGSSDLFAVMKFLRFDPFCVRNYWLSLVQRPLNQGDKNGLSRLQVLMATISLRRTKDKALIGLPPKTIEIYMVELCEEERQVYDIVEGDAKNVVREYISNGSLMSYYTTVLSIVLRLRQICTDMALCPLDLTSLLPSNNIEDVSNNPELLKKMISVLQDGEDFDCPICISPPVDTIITRCAHIFCRVCILKTIRRKSSCPLCRREMTESDIFSAPRESSDLESSEDSPSRATISSKVKALLKLLSTSRDQNPSTKSVVFSQFRKMLILLEQPLKEAGFKFLRLDGSMLAKKRGEVIEKFGESGPDGPTVLLASLKASGAGINLTAASRVYLFEPWWNPAVEEQAMDRVHRIGQKEDVKIVRLIVRNSIEERILELQEKKKKLAREAFLKRGAKERREVSIDDIRTLMSL